MRLATSRRAALALASLLPAAVNPRPSLAWCGAPFPPYAYQLPWFEFPVAEEQVQMRVVGDAGAEQASTASAPLHHMCYSFASPLHHRPSPRLPPCSSSPHPNLVPQQRRPRASGLSSSCPPRASPTSTWRRWRRSPSPSAAWPLSRSDPAARPNPQRQRPSGSSPGKHRRHSVP